jgi:integrase
VGHIERRGQGKWRARYRAPDGRERSRTFARKADAEVFLAGVEADMARGYYVDPAAGRRTFGEQAWVWRVIQLHRPTTAAQVDSHLRNHVLPFFGARPLGSIRPSEIQAWVKDRSTVLAPATVEVVYRYVAAIFRSAVEDRLLAVSPCRGVKLPKRTLRLVKPLATEEVHALVDAVPERYRALVVFTAGTGVRQGEAFGLTLSHLDMLRRQVRIEQQLILLPGRPPYLAPPKTAASHRTIPLPKVVIDALAEHLGRFGTGDDELVFTTEQGHPIRRTGYSAQVWIPSVARAGLPKGTHFHDLRHYYASLLIRHGESVKVVQARLGHATAAETLDTYSHLWPDSEDRTRLAVDEVLGRAPAACTRPAEAPES